MIQVAASVGLQEMARYGAPSGVMEIPLPQVDVD